MSKKNSPISTRKEPTLLHDLRSLIQGVRARVATTVNTELTLLHWRIGKRFLLEKLLEWNQMLQVPESLEGGDA